MWPRDAEWFDRTSWLSCDCEGWIELTVLYCKPQSDLRGQFCWKTHHLWFMKVTAKVYKDLRGLLGRELTVPWRSLQRSTRLLGCEVTVQLKVTCTELKGHYPGHNHGGLIRTSWLSGYCESCTELKGHYQGQLHVRNKDIQTFGCVSLWFQRTSLFCDDCDMLTFGCVFLWFQKRTSLFCDNSGFVITWYIGIWDTDTWTCGCVSFNNQAQDTCYCIRTCQYLK